MPKIIGDLTLYDIEELSESLGINVQTVRKMLAEGKLKGRKLARKWYVTEDNLKAYFDEAEQ